MNEIHRTNVTGFGESPNYVPPANISPTAVNFARRIDQLTAVGGNRHISIKVVIVEGVVYMCVDGGKLERLGKR